MYIDIGIRLIDDQDSIQIYEKHFYGNINTQTHKIEDIENPQRGFHQFLYDYFSSGNKKIRDTLLNRKKKGTVNKEKDHEKSAAIFSNNDLEYMIRIGGGQIVSGRIPLDGFTEKIQTASAFSTDRESGNNIFSEQRLIYNHQSLQIGQFLIQKALEKYESNFHVVNGKITNIY